MKNTSLFNNDQNVFILKFEEIKEQILLVLDELLKFSASQISLSDLTNLQSALETGCTEILTKITELQTISTSNQTSLSSGISQIAEITQKINSLLLFVPSDLANILNTIATQIANLPSQIQPSSTEIPTDLSSSISALQTTLNSVQNTLTTMQNSLTTALQNLPDPTTQLSPEPPFNPPPETILCNHSSRYLPNPIWSKLNMVDLPVEFFIMNNNSPGVLKVEYDIIVTAEITGITSEIYINDDLADTKIFTASIGATHITQTAIFQLNRTDAKVKVHIFSASTAAAEFTNIKYEVVGNNAVILRENYPLMHDLFVCGDNYYFTKQTTTTLEYMQTNANSLNLSQNYQPLVEFQPKCYYAPFLTLSLDTQNKTANLVYFTYTRYNTETGYMENVDRATDYVKCRGLFKINSIMPDVITTNSDTATVLAVQYVSNQYTVSTKTYVCWYASNTLGGTISKKLKVVPIDYANFESFENGVSYAGQGATSRPYMLAQTAQGDWFVAERNELVQGLELGFGTKVKGSQVPTLVGEDIANFSYYRVFMFVYDHWVAKYFKLTKNALTLTMLKAKVIPGDFDQILPGSADEYFTIKNGSIVRHNDPEIMDKVQYKLNK